MRELIYEIKSKQGIFWLLILNRLETNKKYVTWLDKTNDKSDDLLCRTEIASKHNKDKIIQKYYKLNMNIELMSVI